MPLPAPSPGLVISYAYLWKDQRSAGNVEGRKARPCAIVVSARNDDGDTVAYVAPITHVEPNELGGVEIPAAVKRRLGLDDARSWIVTSELNRFVWPGYDLRPIARDRPGTFAWGFLPVNLFAEVKRMIAENHRTGRARVVDRDRPAGQS